LARRIRRDLSNKRIRKIVKGSTSQPAGKFFKSTSSLFNILKPIFFFFLFVMLVFVLYQFIQSIDFQQIISSKDTKKSQNEEMPTTIPSEVKNSSPEEKEISKESEVTTESITQPIQQKPQIEVLNGCGVAGIAKNTVIYLRKVDFDVVYMGNYQNFNLAKSIVIDRAGNREIALKIAESLGISADQVKTEIDKSKQLAASVILGNDYKSLTPFIN